MNLSDRGIYAAQAREAHEHPLVIEPFDPYCLQPASYDVHLGNQFRVFHAGSIYCIDPEIKQDLSELVESEFFVLHPGQFALGATAERFTIPPDMMARIEGKSSLARLGLVIHQTGGFIDPGFDGHITLELSNSNFIPIKLRAGMSIAQMAFGMLDQTCKRPYGSEGLGSKYQGDTGPNDSRFWANV